MAIGRTWQESIQKAIRQVDPSYNGFQGDRFDDLDDALRNPTGTVFFPSSTPEFDHWFNSQDRRWLAVGQALMHENYTVDQVHDLTKIDKWFLHKLMDIVDTQHELEEIGSLFGLRKELVLKAKQQGFSDIQIALAVGCTEGEIRSRRKSMGLKPWVKKIDTLAAEFPAEVRAYFTSF